eukprot:g779.t1
MSEAERKDLPMRKSPSPSRIEGRVGNAELKHADAMTKGHALDDPTESKERNAGGRIHTKDDHCLTLHADLERYESPQIVGDSHFTSPPVVPMVLPRALTRRMKRSGRKERSVTTPEERILERSQIGRCRPRVRQRRKHRGHRSYDASQYRKDRELNSLVEVRRRVRNNNARLRYIESIMLQDLGGARDVDNEWTDGEYSRYSEDGMNKSRKYAYRQGTATVDNASREKGEWCARCNAYGPLHRYCSVSRKYKNAARERSETSSVALENLNAACELRRPDLILILIERAIDAGIPPSHPSIGNARLAYASMSRELRAINRQKHETLNRRVSLRTRHADEALELIGRAVRDRDAYLLRQGLDSAYRFGVARDAPALVEAESFFRELVVSAQRRASSSNDGSAAVQGGASTAQSLSAVRAATDTSVFLSGVAPVRREVGQRVNVSRVLGDDRYSFASDAKGVSGVDTKVTLSPLSRVDALRRTSISAPQIRQTTNDVNTVEISADPPVRFATVQDRMEALRSSAPERGVPRVSSIGQMLRSAKLDGGTSPPTEEMMGAASDSRANVEATVRRLSASSLSRMPSASSIPLPPPPPSAGTSRVARNTEVLANDTRDDPIRVGSAPNLIPSATASPELPPGLSSARRSISRPAEQRSIATRYDSYSTDVRRRSLERGPSRVFETGALAETKYRRPSAKVARARRSDVLRYSPETDEQRYVESFPLEDELGFVDEAAPARISFGGANGRASPTPLLTLPSMHERGEAESLYAADVDEMNRRIPVEDGGARFMLVRADNVPYTSRRASLKPRRGRKVRRRRRRRAHSIASPDSKHRIRRKSEGEAYFVALKGPRPGIYESRDEALRANPGHEPHVLGYKSMRYARRAAQRSQGGYDRFEEEEDDDGRW